MQKTKLIADTGLYLRPRDIFLVLNDLKKYNKPIMITENGLPDSKDNIRPDFLKETFNALDRAMIQDIKLIGYLHWSFSDNFEWADGFAAKFGLIEIDYMNQNRKVRTSAYLYMELISKRSKI